MKFVALIIGILFALGIQAQNTPVFDNHKAELNTKAVKVSRFKSGYGVSKEQDQQPEVNKVSLPAGSIPESQADKVDETKSQSKQAIRKSYYKAGYKLDNSHDMGYIPKASTILE